MTSRKKRWAVLAVVLLAYSLSWALPTPPASTELAVTIIDHELRTPTSYLIQNINNDPPFYVSVVNDHRLSDPAPEQLTALSSARVKFLPGSTQAPNHGTSLVIGSPRPIGMSIYRVNFSYSCGSLCASGNMAILFFDRSHWHVIRAYLTFVS